MKSALLTIFGVAIASSVAAGPVYASETPALDSGITTTADVQDADESAATTTTETASAVESAASAAESAAENLPEASEPDAIGADEPAPAALDTEAAIPMPANSAIDEPIEVTPVTATPPTAPIVLGEIGYDEQGRAGRIHIVVSGDTLWDISDAYLGTPWVWPSVWTDNRDIENPHLIVPGDRIWITAGEMRRVTAEEAERLLAGEPLSEDQPASAADTD